MDEPFLTAANTCGKTLEQMRAHQQTFIECTVSLGKKEDGEEEGVRRAGADPGIPDVGGRHTL